MTDNESQLPSDGVSSELGDLEAETNEETDEESDDSGSEEGDEGVQKKDFKQKFQSAMSNLRKANAELATLKSAKAN